jgi:tetratricopeptide (TPR) repeat protein
MAGFQSYPRYELNKGKRYLAQHNPEKALRYFQRALQTCPVDHVHCLAKILYYTGVSLKKLGFHNSALKSWLSSAKLDKTGHAKKKLKRFCNVYGMMKQKNCNDDDRLAFFSIQLRKYLNSKKTKMILTEAEQDMIRQLIGDYWRSITRSGILEGKEAVEKLHIFKKVSIIFPFYMKEENTKDTLIYVNFVEKQRLKLKDRCSCGSGLPHMACCGRLEGAEELLSGIF